MTRSQLNTQISDILNNAVADGSVTPEMEANAIKLVADYTDGLTVTKVQKTTISEAQILDINSNPVIVLPNTAGKIKYPVSCMIIRNGSGTAYSVPSFLYLSTFGTGAIIQIPENTLTALASTTVGYANSNIVLYDQSFFPLDYTLTSNVANPTGGTGAIDVYVTYIEITL